MADNRDVNHGRARPCYLWLLQSRAKTDQEHRFALGPNTELGPKKPSQFKGRPLCRRGNPPTLPGNFAGHSIAPKQNDIDDPSEFPVLIETYRRIDIGLHPVTYNDSTTTYQMGVPAVTLAGENFCDSMNAVSCETWDWTNTSLKARTIMFSPPCAWRKTLPGESSYASVCVRQS